MSFIDAAASPSAARCHAAPGLDDLVAQAVRLLDRGQPAAFVATVLAVPLLFVTQVETGTALVRAERQIRRHLSDARLAGFAG